MTVTEGLSGLVIPLSLVVATWRSSVLVASPSGGAFFLRVSEVAGKRLAGLALGN